MKRLIVAFCLAAGASTAVSAQTPPATKPPQAAPSPATPAKPPTPPAAAALPSAGGVAPVPLPYWFIEIDTAKKGEVSRADFLKYRLKPFEELDTSKDGKLSLEEFLKIAEPPFAADVQGGPSLEERRNIARGEFRNLDSNGSGFIDRSEAESLIHGEFNQYDTDRDNKVTEPEIRLIVQRSMAREAAERQKAEAQRRQGMTGINDFIDLQLHEVDKLDKNGDGKLSQAEYAVLAGAADGPQTQGLLPFDIRRQLVMRKFAEIDANKDGVLDRAEITAHAVRHFLEMDTNKDRFVSEDEFKAAQEIENNKIRAFLQTIQPPAPPAPAQARPAPTQPRAGQPQPAPGPAPGLPQGTR